MLRKPLTYFDLLICALAAVIFVGLLFVWDSDGHTKSRILITLGSAALVVVLVSVAGAIVQNLFLGRYRTEWSRPISTFVGTTIINSVVILWFSLAGTIMFRFLNDKSNKIIALSVAIILLIGVGFPRLLRARFSRHSLLPYAISFTLAFFIVISVMSKF